MNRYLLDLITEVDVTFYQALDDVDKLPIVPALGRLYRIQYDIFRYKEDFATPEEEKICELMETHINIVAHVVNLDFTLGRLKYDETR